MRKLVLVLIVILAAACSSDKLNDEQNSAVISKFYGWVNSMPGSAPTIHFKGSIEKPDSIGDAIITIFQNDEVIYEQIRLNIIKSKNVNEFVSEGMPVKKNLEIDEPVSIKIEIISSDNFYLYTKDNYKLEQTF